MALWMKFFHVLTAMLFISGLIGRTLIMWQAARASDVQTVKTLVKIAGYFERWLVIPGSLAVLGFGLTTAWLQRWSILGSLQGSASNWLLVSTVLYISLIPVIMFIFVPRGKVFEAALTQAITLGRVTTDLTAAFRDRVVRLAHSYELGVTLVVTLLMVIKPF